VPTFEVTIDQAVWDAMLAGCTEWDKEYRPITLGYGAESVEAMIRPKGGWSRRCDKLQFVVSFNEVQSSGRFHGLRKLVFDAPWYDETLLRERVAFSYMKDLGVPYSCVNHAKLKVNGEDYGVYVNVERVDKEYLERHFEQSQGDLYQYEGSFWETQPELKNHQTTGDLAPMRAFDAATSASELEPIIDVNQFLDVLAGMAMLPDADSYWAGVEINAYFYRHPTRGMLLIPYDMDQSLNGFHPAGPETAVDFDPITLHHGGWVREPQYMALLDDPDHCAAYVRALERARAAYDPEVLEQRIDVWAAQIEELVAADASRPLGLTEYREQVAALRAFPRERAAFIDAWLGAGPHCPAVWPGEAP
jgi:hypothetical protein